MITDTGSEIKFGEGLFEFGDGTSLTTPTIDNTQTGLPAVGMVTFHITHTYAAPGTYVLSYMEPNLKGGIINIFNSVETRFYMESLIVLSPNHSNTSPNFPTNPIIICPLGRATSFSSAAIDDNASNDYYYKYSLVTPMKERGQVVGGYTTPENLKINRDNGIVTWDTQFKGQYLQGLYYIFVRVDKYSHLHEHQGYVLRAMQIIVEDSNSTLELTSSNTDSNNVVVVTDGQEKKIKVILAENNTVPNLKFDLYYNKVIKNNISLVQYDSAGGGRKLRVAILTLKTTSDIVKDLPYPITLRGSAGFQIDITFLYMTRQGDLPDPEPEEPEVITGLPDLERVRIYPNPFRSEVFVEGTDATEATFINSIGQAVMTSGLRQGEPVNTTGLPAGFYLLQLTNKEGISSKFKLVRY